MEDFQFFVALFTFEEFHSNNPAADHCFQTVYLFSSLGVQIQFELSGGIKKYRRDIIFACFAYYTLCYRAGKNVHLLNHS